MKYFFGCTFMNREELQNIGVKYPIKLEYYKTQTNEESIKNVNDIRYGIEVIKTSYIEEKVDVEKTNIPEIIKDEAKVENISITDSTDKIEYRVYLNGKEKVTIHSIVIEKVN